MSDEPKKSPATAASLPPAAATALHHLRPIVPAPPIQPAFAFDPMSAAAAYNPSVFSGGMGLGTSLGSLAAVPNPLQSNPPPLIHSTSNNGGAKRKAAVLLAEDSNNVHDIAGKADAETSTKKKSSSPSTAGSTSALVDLTTANSTDEGIITKKTRQEGHYSNKKNRDTTQASSSVRADPLGFEAFQRDPLFINSILAISHVNNGSTDPLLGPLAQGLINMTDEQIFNMSSDDQNKDATVTTFVIDVIMPLLGISDNIALRSNWDHWQGYAHISSEHLLNLAKNFFFDRRSSMKAAVHVAFYEMRKNHVKIIKEKLRKAMTVIGSGRYSSSNANSESNKRIHELERELQRQKEYHAKMMKEIEKIYEKDIEEMMNDHRDEVEKLKRTNKELKEEMEDMKCSHREFLENYVHVAAEAVVHNNLAHNHRQGKKKTFSSF
jgi:hypothetical protein